MENNREKVRIVIVDDDCKSRDVLRTALAPYEWAQVVGETADVEETEQIIADLSPDLLFLDIELNDESAIDAIADFRSATDGKMKIVFYTSYKKYLMQALRMEAFDFLLKPIDPEELRLIMSRYLLESNHNGNTAAGSNGRQTLPRYVPAAPSGISITTVTNDRMILFPRDIVFFRYDSDRKLWEAVLTSLQHLILKRNTTADTILNYGPDFVRTHKSYIVNVAFISMISGNECRLIPPFDSIVDIKISKIYRRPLLDRFYDL